MCWYWWMMLDVVESIGCGVRYSQCWGVVVMDIGSGGVFCSSTWRSGQWTIKYVLFYLH